MAAMPLRQQVIDYVDQLDDEHAEMVLAFTQTLVNANKNIQNSKTPAERLKASQALAELESINFNPKTEISLDGRKEKAEYLWRKYESLS